MALPSGITSATYTFGSAVTFMGEPASVSVTVEPTTYVVWVATGSPIIPVRHQSTGESITQVELPHVDQDGFVDASGAPITGFGFKTTVNYISAGGSFSVSKTLQPLVGQATMDFDLVPGGESSAPVIGDIAFVSSFGGLTGAVTGEEAAAVVDPYISGGTGAVSSVNGMTGDVIIPLFSGAYTDLTGKPSIPSQPSDIGAQPAGDYALNSALFSGQYADLVGAPTLFSGSYVDLTNKPVIPTQPSDIGAQPAGDYALSTEVFSGAYSDLTGTPTLFSGSYTDLTDKPAIPEPVSLSTIPAGSTITVHGDVARPTARTDVTVQWVVATTPTNAIAGDTWVKAA